MGVAGGPKIEIDGLVFGYDTSYGIDTNNISSRFYPGRPTTNFISNPQLTSISNTTVGNASITKQDFGNGRIGLRFIQFATSNIVSFTPSLTSFSPVSGGTYTFSADVRSTTTGKTLKNQLWVYVNGVRHWLTDSLTWSTSTTENGVLLTASNATNTWERHSVSFTLPSGTLTSFGISGFYRRTSNFVTDVANLQLELNSNNTPFIDGTRSSTESLIDLTKTTNIDVSNVSFDSTGQPTFDGTDDYIDVTSMSGFSLKNITIIAKPFENITPSYLGYYPQWMTQLNSFYIAQGEWTSGATNETFHIWNSNGTMTHIRDNISNDWHQFVWNWNGTTYDCYIDGIQKTTYARSTGHAELIAINTDTLRLGANFSTYFYKGDMAVIKMYNRTLSAEEIKQNFNAYKNRFNL